MSNLENELITLRTLLALFAEEAYEEYGNDDEQVQEYMENCIYDAAVRLRDWIPEAMADYRSANDPSERGL